MPACRTKRGSALWNVLQLQLKGEDTNEVDCGSFVSAPCRYIVERMYLSYLLTLAERSHLSQRFPLKSQGIPERRPFRSLWSHTLDSDLSAARQYCCLLLSSSPVAKEHGYQTTRHQREIGVIRCPSANYELRDRILKNRHRHIRPKLHAVSDLLTRVTCSGSFQSGQHFERHPFPGFSNIRRAYQMDWIGRAVTLRLAVKQGQRHSSARLLCRRLWLPEALYGGNLRSSISFVL